MVFNSSDLTPSFAIDAAPSLAAVDTTAAVTSGNSADVLPPGRTKVAGTRVSEWQTYRETVGGKDCAKSVTGGAGNGPIEQLELTENDSDYLWYEVTTSTGTGTYTADTVGYDSITYVYVDGKLKTSQSAWSPTPMHDTAAAAAATNAVAATATANASASATATVQILSCAMGLSNGGVGPGSVKGVKNLKLNGKVLNDSGMAWTQRWMLRGKYCEVNTGRVSELKIG